jgi:hypothetical protein
MPEEYLDYWLGALKRMEVETPRVAANVDIIAAIGSLQLSLQTRKIAVLQKQIADAKASE